MKTLIILLLLCGTAYAACIHELGTSIQVFLLEQELKDIQGGYAVHRCGEGYSVMVRPPLSLVTKLFEKSEGNYCMLKSEKEFQDEIWKYGIPSQEYIKKVCDGFDKRRSAVR